jgi:hypothetical protein
MVIRGSGFVGRGVLLILAGEQFAGRTHGTLDLPERAAPMVAQRVQRADFCERRQLVTPQTGAADQVFD